MKAVLGMVSLLVVLAVVGVLARKQLGAASGVAGAVSAPAAPATAEAVVVPGGTPQQQIRQVQQAVQGAMQERPMPDDIK